MLISCLELHVVVVSLLVCKININLKLAPDWLNLAKMTAKRDTACLTLYKAKKNSIYCISGT